MFISIAGNFENYNERTHTRQREKKGRGGEGRGLKADSMKRNLHRLGEDT